MPNLMHGYLLDTHIIIWLLSEPKKLSFKSRDIILNLESQLYYSLISMSEIAIKASIGKLDIGDGWQAIYQSLLQEKDIQPLPLNWQSVQILQDLPFYHRDPFDRILIAQAMANNLSFLSADLNCHQYDLSVIW